MSNTLPIIQRRPRELLQQGGVESLSLEQILAILLSTGPPGKGVMGLSHDVAQLLQMGKNSLQALAAIPGVGIVKAGRIVAALRLGELLTSKELGQALTSPQAVYTACLDLISLPQEHLVVFYLNSRHFAVEREVISIGTASASLIHPREVYRPAILQNATAIILAHNHPSGDATPSEADRLVTEHIALAGKMLGIELLDHVICGSPRYISLKEAEPNLFR